MSVYVCCFAGLKRKRSLTTASESVTLTRSVQTPAKLSANVSEPSTDTTAKPGPAAKRSRPTTLTSARQLNSNDSVKLAGFSSADVDTKHPISDTDKQSIEEDHRVPRNCKISSLKHFPYFIMKSKFISIIYCDFAISCFL